MCVAPQSEAEQGPVYWADESASDVVQRRRKLLRETIMAGVLRVERQTEEGARD